MSAAGDDEGDGKFIRFVSYKIRTEKEYELRMATMRQLVMSAEGSSTTRWWSLMGLMDDWEYEDMHPFLSPPNKKLKCEQNFEPLPSSPRLFGVQSPLPGQGVQQPQRDQGLAASSVLAAPVTPPEFLANKVSAAETAKAELIARNKAAALLRREQKLVPEQLESSLEGLWQLHCL